MKNAGQAITLYNYFLDPETGYDTCTRAYIRGVSVFGKAEVSVTKEGFVSADVYTVRVPTACGEYTFRAGDVIVAGEAVEERPSRAELEEKYPVVLTVVSCTDNREKREGHWKVVCQ